MKWTRIYRLYNQNKLKSSKILLLFIMISVMITVCISLSIPQVIAGTEEYLSGQAKDMNHGDLKIIATHTSQPFEQKLSELEADGVEISKSKVYSISVKYNSNKLFCQLIEGEYDLEADEIILSKDIAGKLGLSVKDSIDIMNQTFTIKRIDKSAFGVDATSEMFGYCKVSAFDTQNNIATAQIYFINTSDIEAVKSELELLEPQYTYTTVEDQEIAIQEKLNMNLIALSTLNTMSILMSILSTISTILMIIIQRRSDIAIMKLISINNKAITKAFRAELKLMIVLPLAIGAFVSIPLAQYLLSMKQVEGKNNHLEYALLGFVLYSVIYFVFINIATGVIAAIKPLSVLKNEKVSWKKPVLRIGVSAILFSLVSLLLYSVFIGKGSAMISSFAIVFFIVVFFLITLLITRIAVRFTMNNKILKYTMNSIRSNSFSFALTVLSIALTMWFVLFGFSMETTCKESYNSTIQEKINYNYMMVSDDVQNSEKELKANADVQGYSKLSREVGAYYDAADNRERTVILCSINRESYHQQFKVISGQDLFIGGETEVLISDKFGELVDKGLGDSISLWMNNQEVTHTIKGIYNSGGVNDNFILKRMEEGAVEQKVIFLIKADSEEFLTNISDASLVDINVMGEAILKMLGDFLLVFKYLCGICIVAAILFNSNMIYMNHINNEREAAILRALGLGKVFLYKSMLISFGTSLMLSLVIAMGLYLLLLKAALKVALGSKLEMSAYALRLPALFVLIIAMAYCLLSLYLIRRTEGFEVLRDQV